MIKLIVTDMDGTLLKSDGTLPDNFYDTFYKLREKGIIFLIASGRQYHTLLNNFNEVRDSISVIAENGAIVIHQGKKLFSKKIDRDKALEIVKDVKQVKNCDVVLCGSDYAYVEDKNMEFAEAVNKYYHHTKVIRDLQDFPQDEVLKIAVYDYEDAKSARDELYPRWGNEFQLIVSGKHWMDYGRLDVDKGTALEHLQKYFNIQPGETVVFGDYFNDVPMFDKAYYSFAMENAPDGVKDKARFTAGSNDSNGVIEKINELISDGNV